MDAHPIRAETIRLVVLGLLVVALGSAVALVLAPFMVSMLWAGILAFATWPLYARLLQWTGGRDWASALCMTMLMAAIVVLPTLWLLHLLRADVSVLADYLTQELQAGRLHPPALVASLPIVGPELMAWLDALLAEPQRWQTELKALLGKLDNELWTLLGGVGTFFGPVLGAGIVISLQNMLADKVGSWVTVIIGVIFVLCVIAFRKGVVGEIQAYLERRSNRKG